MAGDFSGKTAAVKTSGIHDGHRQRLKERFHKEGLEHFQHHEVLEMLLYFGIPMKNTNELAHELLETFGSLTSVLEAPYEELLRIKGVSQHVATLLCFSSKLAHVYYEDKLTVGNILEKTADIGKYLLPRFIDAKNEQVVLLCMDNRRHVINATVIFVGSVNSTEINVRLVMQQALRDNATIVVIAHNHPSGHAIPSREDIHSTMVIAKALSVADIRLIDHIVVAENDFVSMADTPTLSVIFHRTWKMTESLLNDDAK